MSKLRISDAPLLPDVDGTEKIPTGGRGDYAISVDQIKDHIFQDVGKELVGLGNVDNTSDLDKPVSTAQQAALNLKADKTYVDTNLDLKADKTNVYTRTETSLALSKKADLVSGVIPESQIPSSFNDVLEFTTPNLPIVGESGKIYVTTDNNKTWRWATNKYVEISGWNPDSVSKRVTIPTYNNAVDGVDPVTGVADGEYFNVRSSSDASYIDEYHNVGGVATPTGKSYLSAIGVELQEKPASTIKDTSGLDQQQINDNRTMSIKDYFSAGNGTQHIVKDLYTGGSSVYTPRFKNFADVQAFYGTFVDSENYLLDQAALEKASMDASAKGGDVVRIQPGVYFYKRLTIRTGVIFWGDDPQSVSLVCVDPNTLDPNVTTHGSSIKKPDDGQRVYRAGFVNMFLSTGAAGTGSNQPTYQKVIGINLCGCERTIMQNVSFAGFGYGALALARAENGAEGLGFLNTTHDGNYNVFDNLSFGSCGRYNPDNAVIWLKYKANSNKFYSIFAKGCTDAFLFVIDRSNDNFVAGGTLESSKGVAHLGLTVAASGNTIIGIRIEGASGDGYIFDTYATNNFVLGGYHTGVTGQDFKIVNPNNRILAGNTNYLRNVVFPPVTNYSTLHNLAALQVSSINGGVSHPLYIKSEEYNNPLNYPKAVFYNDVINLVAGNILGELTWSNRDTSRGAAGESASIQAVAEGSSGETAIVIKTGTGTTAVERMRVKANGDIVSKKGVGMYGVTPPAIKPTITGKQTPTTVAEIAAVQSSIIAALVALGAVTDGRTT